MIKLLQNLWANISAFLFPADYYAWQTLIYLGIFSLTMSWVARLTDSSELTVGVIATGSWIFFALGIGWFLENAKVRPLGIPIAPWVMGAIACLYFLSFIQPENWTIGFTSWPLISVAIIALPAFFTWELQPKIPPPPVRQHLILLTLIALLFSNWFQFYFRLQNWLEDYPSLLADDFNHSGFVYRASEPPMEKARGVVLLTSAESEITDALNDTPWPYVERWLLGLDEKLAAFTDTIISSLTSPQESSLWQLQADSDALDNGGYILNLMAIWSGPASTQNGYYLKKTCTIDPQTINTANPSPTPGSQSTPMAKVECDLDTPKNAGQPPLQ